MDKQLINQVIEILKRSDQRLVWLESIICPVRKLVGEFYKDSKMTEIFNYLYANNIIEDGGGFISRHGEPHLYITSVTLTSEFFNKNCQKAYKQRRLF
jgi:hypothetical protein